MRPFLGRFLLGTFEDGPPSGAPKRNLPKTVWCSRNPGSRIDKNRNGIPESGFFLDRVQDPMASQILYVFHPHPPNFRVQNKSSIFEETAFLTGT